MSLFDEIRSGCRWVAENAQHVHINIPALPDYARSLPLDHALASALDPQHHYVGHDEATANYILILDAINFGSGYFPHLRKRPGLSGYFTIAAALTERFADQGPFNPADLIALQAADCARLLAASSADLVWLSSLREVAYLSSIAARFCRTDVSSPRAVVSGTRARYATSPSGPGSTSTCP